MVTEPPPTVGDGILDAIGRGDFNYAYQLARAGAERGDSDAQLHLGWLFHAGKGVSKDLSAAEHWYRSAVRAYNPRAEFYLGSLFWSAGDTAQAREWFERSAEHGFAPALYQLRQIYHRGLGVEPDQERAVNYLERAAKLGHMIAQRDIIREMVRGKRGITRIPIGLVRFLGLTWSLVRVLARNEHDEAVLRL